jgi:hypothetical protein
MKAGTQAGMKNPKTAGIFLLMKMVSFLITVLFVKTVFILEFISGALTFKIEL